MKKLIKNNKNFIIALFVILVILTISTVTSANGIFEVVPDNNTDDNSFVDLPDEGNNTNDTNIYGNNSNTNTNTNTNTNNNTNTNTNNNTNTNRNANTNSSKLPQTGIQDYTIGIMIIICIASAIYAYKKVKDYNNI